MNRNTSAAVLSGLALFLATTPIFSQERQQRGPRPMGSSVQFLLENVEPLGLTADQVEVITAIGEDLRATSEPTVAKLREMRESGDMRSQRDAAMPLMQDLMEQDNKATQQALGSMEDSQRQAAERLLEERRQEMQHRRRRRDAHP